MTQRGFLDLPYESYCEMGTATMAFPHSNGIRIRMDLGAQFNIWLKTYLQQILSIYGGNDRRSTSNPSWYEWHVVNGLRQIGAKQRENLLVSWLMWTLWTVESFCRAKLQDTTYLKGFFCSFLAVIPRSSLSEGDRYRALPRQTLNVQQAYRESSLSWYPRIENRMPEP